MLATQPTDGGWSPVEVLQHLNFYADFYTQAMETAMERSTQPAAERYHPGWFGSYFVRVIGPAGEDGQLPMKMTTPANARPENLPPATSDLAVETFLQHQNRLLYLLHQARNKHLGKVRVPTSLSTMLRLKLGDTFRFVIAHQERHFQQIQRALSSQPSGQVSA
jgi:hypothetical protein